MKSKLSHSAKLPALLLIFALLVSLAARIKPERQ
jgi:hypothetical protein